MASEELTLSIEEKAVFNEVLKALRQMSHGYIQLVVQDSRVIQIEKTEKLRLTKQSDGRVGK